MLKPQTILHPGGSVETEGDGLLNDARLLHEVLPVLEALAGCVRARMDQSQANAQESTAYENYTKLLGKHA